MRNSTHLHVPDYHLVNNFAHAITTNFGTLTLRQFTNSIHFHNHSVCFEKLQIFLDGLLRHSQTLDSRFDVGFHVLDVLLECHGQRLGGWRQNHHLNLVGFVLLEQQVQVQVLHVSSTLLLALCSSRARRSPWQL